MKDLGLWLKWLSGVLPALAFLGAATVWGMDSRYVQLEQLQSFMHQQRMVSLQDKVEELTIKVEMGKADDYDRARLRNLERKLKAELGD